MAIGSFFGVLALLLIVGLPVAGVFGGMALLPSVLDPQFTYGHRRLFAVCSVDLTVLHFLLFHFSWFLV